MKRYQIISKDAGFFKVIKAAQTMATENNPVLLRGETGTGKGLLATFIHYTGPRLNHPFVTVRGEHLEKKLRESRLKDVLNGTLYIDEIGHSSLKAQKAFFQIIDTLLSTPSFERRQNNGFRIISGSSQDLERAVSEGTFQKELLERFFLCTITLPPLRARTVDIPLLVKFFSHKTTGNRPEAGTIHFSESALNALVDYPWPGNVRELKKVVEHLGRFSSKHEIGREDLPREIRDKDLPISPEPLPARPSIPRVAPASVQCEFEPEQEEGLPFNEKIEQYKRSLLVTALKEVEYNQKMAAHKLGLTYDQFRHYYRKYSLHELLNQ